MFEDTIAQIEGMPAAHIGDKRCVLVFCADNGVVEEGVTQTGSEVTAAVAGNMVSGNATVCKMAKVAGADVFPVDIGMLRPVEGVRDEDILRGTGNFYRTRAMSREDCEKANHDGRFARERTARGRLFDDSHGRKWASATPPRRARWLAPCSAPSPR